MNGLRLGMSCLNGTQKWKNLTRSQLRISLVQWPLITAIHQIIRETINSKKIFSPCGFQWWSRCYCYHWSVRRLPKPQRPWKWKTHLYLSQKQENVKELQSRTSTELHNRHSQTSLTWGERALAALNTDFKLCKSKHRRCHPFNCSWNIPYGNHISRLQEKF
jgi:hypothetical protein